METQADDIVRGSSSFRTPPIPVVPYSHPRDPDAIGSPASAPARSPRKAIEEGGDVPIPNPDGGGAVVALPRFFGVIPTWPPRIQGSGPHDGSAWILVASSLLHACAPWHVAHGGRQRRRRRVCCRGWWGVRYGTVVALSRSFPRRQAHIRPHQVSPIYTVLSLMEFTYPRFWFFCLQNS
jgi:hypothetical protein